MVRRKNDHSRRGIVPKDVGQRQKHSCRRPALRGLKNEYSRSLLQLWLGLGLVLPCDHSQNLFRSDQMSHPIQSVLEQGPCPDEGTELFRFLPAQPLLNEGLHALPLAACQYNRPQWLLPHFRAHDGFLNTSAFSPSFEGKEGLPAALLYQPAALAGE